MDRLFIILLALSSSALTQGQEKNDDILISSGNTINSNELSINWIIGENLIDYEVLGNHSQPGDSLIHPNHFFYKAYPSITSGPLCLSSQIENPPEIYIHIYNTAKRRVKILKWSSNPMNINLHKLPGGMYFIHLIDTDHQAVATFKIIKK